MVKKLLKVIGRLIMAAGLVLLPLCYIGGGLAGGHREAILGVAFGLGIVALGGSILLIGARL